MRSPVAMSNGCAPVLASYSAITLFTSSMSAVAGSYSRSVVSPWDENVRILAVMFDLLRGRPFAVFCGTAVNGGLGPLRSYCTVSPGCQYTTADGAEEMYYSRPTVNIQESTCAAVLPPTVWSSPSDRRSRESLFRQATGWVIH